MGNRIAIEHTDSYLKSKVDQAMDRICISLGMNPANPFGSFIKTGDRVFIKPNWVASRWRASCQHNDSLYCVITHPAVIEAVADRVALALGKSGEIVIGDNPSIDADFEELMEFTGIRKLERKYAVACRILDLRPLVCKDLQYYGQRDKMVSQTGDPIGYEIVNLEKSSLLYNENPNLFRGVFNEREETVAAHTDERQLYTYSKTLFDSDVYISIPKLKTHQKVGATLNLKGLVGSICNKNQLVHWKVGYPDVGGDEYPDKESFEKSKTQKVTHRGAWPGNDTIWRMVVDLYRGLLTRPRKYFTVIDGIVGGEGKGPFCPTSKYSNTLIAGDNLLLADIIAARYMGFDPRHMKYLSYLIKNQNIDLSDIQVIENGMDDTRFFYNDCRYLDFEVPEQWEPIKWKM